MNFEANTLEMSGEKNKKGGDKSQFQLEQKDDFQMIKNTVIWMSPIYWKEDILYDYKSLK